MNRRLFLRSSVHGVTLVALPTLVGCRLDQSEHVESTHGTGSASEVEFDPGPYTVDDRWLVFDDEGAAFEFAPEDHVIRRVHRDGATVDHFGGQSHAHEVLNHPSDAAVGSGGKLYVLDRGNRRVQVLDANGRVVETLGEGELTSATDFVVHANSVYVCDTAAHRVVRFDLAGRTQQIYTSAPNGQLNGPRGVAVDPEGHVHVLDAGRAQVVVLDEGGLVRSTYGNYGDEPGSFVLPTSVACTSTGRSFVSDIGSGFVSAFDASGSYLGRFRPRDADGEIVAPERVTVRADDTLHISTGGHSAFSEG